MIVSVPGPVIVSAGGDCQAAVPDVTGNVVATDNCTPTNQLQITQTPAAGTMVGGGQYPITVTVTDASGNSSTGVVTLTVVDTTAPSIVSVPGPITISADGNCQAAVPDVTASVVATDNCTASNQLQITQSPAAGTLLAGGQYLITVTVTDASGNSSNASVPLTIVATSAPVIQSVTANPNVLTPPNHQLVPVTVSVVASNGCGSGALVSKISGISCSEPASPGDIQITGNLTALLAASKDSTGNTRTYTITVQATDASGNSSTSTVLVAVPKSNGSSAGTGTTTTSGSGKPPR
jgi:hypothetical protein